MVYARPGANGQEQSKVDSFGTMNCPRLVYYEEVNKQQATASYTHSKNVQIHEF